MHTMVLWALSMVGRDPGEDERPRHGRWPVTAVPTPALLPSVPGLLPGLGAPGEAEVPGHGGRTPTSLWHGGHNSHGSQRAGVCPHSPGFVP